jgi:hypothetical protein
MESINLLSKLLSEGDAMSDDSFNQLLNEISQAHAREEAQASITNQAGKFLTF